MKIGSSVSTSSDVYAKNYAFNQAQLQDHAELVEKICFAGGEEKKKKQHARGKLTVRERIEKLLDPGSDFLELSSLAGYELYDTPVPCGGILTGVGQVSGRLCMIVANDPTVKGGTYYPITVKKHLRAQEIAEKNHLPCLYLVDSGGAFLPMQDEVFPDKDDFGRIFYNQARMSAKKIPQIASVHGFCTAGGAYIPAMSDQSIIVEGNGTIFLAGPPLVEAATGEVVSAEDLGGARVHTEKSGVVDHLARDDAHAMAIMRQVVRYLGVSKTMPVRSQQPREPLYDAEELLGILPDDVSKPFEMREILARILDGSELFEFKKDYGTTLICGFAHLGGFPVGVLANNGVLFSESALKGTHFIELCVQEKIPLLFFQNVTGFMVGSEYEHGGIAKHGAKLVHAVANANVPKLTLVVGGSFGAGNYGMCGRGFDPNFMFMWPTSKISVMGGAQAAFVLVMVKRQQLEKQGKQMTSELEAEIRQPVEAKYAREGHATYASARLWDDGILDPRDTRRVLSQALAACMHTVNSETQFGIFRM
ncbi:MAG: methylcrotonoyl-CoA carboxylase [Zetaproteobacteria bacterium]|nr:methylcrotonoyl-CoA carboxylase [Zetaproteobacteria bacterium]